MAEVGGGPDLRHQGLPDAGRLALKAGGDVAYLVSLLDGAGLGRVTSIEYKGSA